VKAHGPRGSGQIRAGLTLRDRLLLGLVKDSLRRRPWLRRVLARAGDVSLGPLFPWELRMGGGGGE
jgi:hypothetical protein